jgi:hypothetical protein
MLLVVISTFMPNLRIHPKDMAFEGPKDGKP